MNDLEEPDLSKPSTIINGVRYYTKKVNKYNEGVELVVEKLANLVGINCAHYGIIEKDGEKYYLSEEIKGFVNSEIFSAYKHSIEDILDYINKTYPDQAVKITDEIIRIFLFDILLLNGDRNSHNWGFANVDGNIEVWILDNELAFYGYEKAKLTFSENGYIIMLGINNKVISQNITELLYLIDTSSEIYTDMLINMLDILTPSAVSDIFKEVETSYYINISNKEKLLNNYITNYNIINDLVRGRIL